MDLCGNVDILVIDDLGAESGSSNVDREASRFVQEILYSVANHRQDKTTIITTNLNKEKRAMLYDTKMLSRLYRDNEMVVFTEMPDETRKQNRMVRDESGGKRFDRIKRHRTNRN